MIRIASTAEAIFREMIAGFYEKRDAGQALATTADGLLSVIFGKVSYTRADATKAAKAAFSLSPYYKAVVESITSRRASDGRTDLSAIVALLRRDTGAPCGTVRPAAGFATVGDSLCVMSAIFPRPETPAKEGAQNAPAAKDSGAARALAGVLRRATAALHEEAIRGGVLGAYLEGDMALFHAADGLLAALKYSSFEALAQSCGGSFLQCLHPDDREEASAIIQEALENGSEFRMKCRVLCANRGYIWAEALGRGLSLPGVRPAFLCMVSDVTDSEALEREIDARSAEAVALRTEIRELTRGRGGGIVRCTADAQSAVVYMSESFSCLLGYTHSQLKEKFANSLYPLIAPADAAILREKAAAGEDMAAEYALQTGSGKDIFVRDRRTVIEEDGQRFYYCAILDVTAERQAARRYQAMLDGVPTPLLMLDGEDRAAWINERALALLGKAREDVLGQRCSALPAPFGGEEGCIAACRKNGGAAEPLEIRDGVYRAELHPCPGGGHVAALFDTSPVMERERVIRSMTEDVGYMELRADAGFSILHLGEGVSRLLGYTPEDMESMFAGRFAPLLGPSEAERLQQAAGDAAARQGQEFELELPLICKDGAVIRGLLRARIAQKEGDAAILRCTLLDISRQKDAENRARQDSLRLHAIMAMCSQAMFEYDAAQRQIICTDKLTRMLGWRPVIEDAPEALVVERVIDRESVKDFLAAFDALANGAETSAAQVLLQGSGRWIEVRLMAVRRAGSPAGAIGIVEDITASMARQAAHQEECALRNRLAAGAFASWETDLDAPVLQEDWLDAIGAEEGEALSCIFRKSVDTYVYPEDSPAYSAAFDPMLLLRGYRRGEMVFSAEYRACYGEDAEYRWVRRTTRLSEDPQTAHAVAFSYLEDIDEAKTQELAAAARAERDALTGTWSRAAAEVQIREAMREDTSLAAVLRIDIDQFSRVNEVYGQMYGDAVISQCALRIGALSRRGDIVGHTGADEFTVLLRELGSAELAELSAEVLCAELSRPFVVDRANIQITVSVGVAVRAYPTEQADALIAKADTALFRARDMGGGQVVLFAGPEEAP